MTDLGGNPRQKPLQSFSGRRIDITAVYTGVTWWWAKFHCADQLHVPVARWVFWITNWALAVLGVFRPIPSLRHGLVQRHFLIDRLLVESNARRVVEGAAGFSPRGLSVSQDPGISYVEIDMGDLVETKLRLLSRTQAGREAAVRPNMKILAADLFTVDFSELHLGPEPVFFITEGLLMYLSADEQRALWRRFADYLKEKPGSTYVFDLLPGPEEPEVGWSGRLLGLFMGLFLPGRGFVRDTRDRSEIVGDLQDCGFSDVRLLEPGTADPAWRTPHLDRSTRVLLFICRV